MNKVLLVTTISLIAALSATAASASPLAPVQISSWPSGSSDAYNFNFQQTAINPTNGKGMIVTYIAKGANGPDYYPLVVAQPIDAAGAADGAATTLIENSAGSSPATANAQPSVAYNPTTGGWLACYVNGAANAFACQHLNADGTLDGAAFPISASAGGAGRYSGPQTNIAWSSAIGKFAVLLTYNNSVSVQLVDPAGGTSGAAIPIPFDYATGGGSISGGADIAYSPTSNTFLITFHANELSSEQQVPYTWLLDGNAHPVGSALRSATTTTDLFSSGSLAYSRSRNEFDLVAGQATTPFPIVVWRYSATDGSKVGSPAVSANLTPSDPVNNNQYYRPAIAANPVTGDDLIAVTMRKSDVNQWAVYGLTFSPTSGVGTPEIIDGGTSAAVTPGYRPRVKFNASTCELLVTYNRLAGASGSDGWQLFSTRYPQASPCSTTAALTVTKAGAGSGTVTSSPTGIDCGATCSASFDEGSSITLTASAGSGSTFGGWTGDCYGVEATCTVTMSQARSVAATFNAQPTPPTPPTPPSNQFTITSSASRGSSAVTRVRVPGAGKITQRGTYRTGGASSAATRTACTDTRTATAAGTYTLTCRLNAAARRQRTRGALRVRLVTTFTPTGGTPRAAVRTVVFPSIKPSYTG